MRGLLFACVLGWSIVAHANAPTPTIIDAPAFSIAPADLIAAARAARPIDPDVDVLGESFDFAIEHDRVVQTWHVIFVVRSDDGAREWSSLADTYRSYQDRPIVRARVIGANGVAELDPKRATDAPAVQAQLDSDARKLLAPLPPVSPGDVVEEELVTVEHGALSHAGADWRVQLALLGATAASRVTVSVPAGLKIKFSEHALPAGVHPQHATAAGRETWSYSLGALNLAPAEGQQPADIYDHPTIAFSTIPSWNALARELRAMIDAQIAAGSPAWPTGVVKAATLDGARVIVDWARHHMRDAGIDVDDSLVHPFTPADSLSRGVADILSQATLVAALLREAGIHADVALVDIAPGIDAEPDLAGLTGFDRALVRARIDGKDVWIEPSDRFVPIGKLAPRSRGRHALVLADDTAALTTLPVAAMADNEVHEVRTYELLEGTFARVSEVSRESGDFAASNRTWLSATDASDQHKQFDEYVQAHYGGPLKSSTAPLGDLDAPTVLTLEVGRSERASAQREQWGAYLWPHDVLLKLPEAFGARAPNRDHDLLLETPYLYELENRIIVPDGYELPDTAPEQVKAIGPLRLTERQRVDGRTFVVTYRLAVDKVRYTPAEVAALRDAADALTAEYVSARSTAWQLLDEGKYREAIAEVKRRIDIHPREALHHEDLAGLYVELGAGAAARREAHVATQLEPKRAIAWTMLGWALEHDSFGQVWGFDHDRAGARAAYDKARVLDPTYADAPVELAAMLEVDMHGRRVAGGADLRAAITAWRAAYKIDASAENAVALARALIWNGQPGDAEAILREVDGTTGDALLIASIALGKRGVPAALHDAEELVPDQAARKADLVEAGRLALALRAYDVARGLFAHGDPSAMTPSMVEMLARVVRHDDAFKVGKQPGDAIIELDIESVHHDRAHVACWDTETDGEVFSKVRSSVAKFDNADLPVALVDDLFRSAIDFKIEGDASAWRVEATQFGSVSVLYVASDRGTPKVIGAPDALQSVGRYVLRLLAKNDDDTARRVLDWVTADRGRDALFAAVWGANLPIDHAEMQLAAAQLAAPTAADRVVPIMTACGASTTDGQIACDAAVIDALGAKKRWADVLDFATAWEARATKQVLLVPELAHATALAELGHFDNAETTVQAALQQYPDSSPLMLLQMQIATASGDLALAWQRASRLIARNRPNAHELNQAAWLGLYTASDLPAAENAARQAVQLSPQNGAIVNTLAALELEVGELRDGKKHALEAMHLADRDKPGEADWYALARYWEQLDLRDDAIAAYKRVVTPEAELGTPSAAQLAQRRLAALKH